MKISFWHKNLWRLARTPLIHIVKQALRLKERRQIIKRKTFAKELHVDDCYNELSKSLLNDGYCFLDNVVDKNLLSAISIAGAQKLDLADNSFNAQVKDHKDFWLRLLDSDKCDGALLTDNPFVSFALQSPILSVLVGFFGEIPLLDDVLLTLSRTTKKSFSLSQLWHRDYDDTKTVKLFVYLTDVASKQDGPFTFIDGPSSDRVGSSLRSRRGDIEILERLPSDAINEVIAPRLSVFMVNTSRCLHMGSRVAEGHERLLYTASYISSPRIYPEPAPRFQTIGNEPEVVRLLLGLQIDRK